MAKMDRSVLMNSLSGVAGSVVFKNTKVGIVVTPRVSPSNPQTPAQQAVRAAFTTASRQWKNFSTAQVAAWETYAAANAPDYDSGINAFMQLGIKAILVAGGGNAPTTPPTSAFTGDSIKVNVTATTGKLTFTATAANAAGVTTEVLYQALKSKNRKPQKNAYKVGAYKAFTSGSLTLDVPVPAGYYVAGYRFVLAATGQATGFVSTNIPGPVTLSLATPSASETSKKKAA